MQGRTHQRVWLYASVAGGYESAFKKSETYNESGFSRAGRADDRTSRGLHFHSTTLRGRSASEEIDVSIIYAQKGMQPLADLPGLCMDCRMALRYRIAYTFP